jgi:hypothetical protein
MKKILIALFLLRPVTAFAVADPPIQATTIPTPTKITAGLTYQVIAPSAGRRSLTIQNNNATDSCNIIVGGPWAAGDTTTTSRTINGVSVTGAQAAIVLVAGAAYTRYYPIVPTDAILGTCATTGDSIYVDIQ